jgi:hypothetical protein
MKERMMNGKSQLSKTVGIWVSFLKNNLQMQKQQTVPAKTRSQGTSEKLRTRAKSAERTGEFLKRTSKLGSSSLIFCCGSSVVGCDAMQNKTSEEKLCATQVLGLMWHLS